MTKILLIDEDGEVRDRLTEVWKESAVEFVTAKTGEEGIELQAETPADLIILDTILPATTGLEVFERLRAMDKRVPVIFVAKEADSETAINAMMRGAFEFLEKPIDLEKLQEVVSKAIRTSKLMNVQVAVATEDNPHLTGESFIGRSSEMIEVFKEIGKVARQNVTVLVRGESGSGKELVARAVYQHSDRSEEPFVAVNCAALPDNLLESELFGHEKGSFTGADRQRIGKFEQCDGGTIFLDEIGDMALMVQAKVLRLLQQQEFERVGGNETIKTDVRIIAATNQPLEAMVETGKFREDLYFRLKETSISLPALRERPDDLQPLIEYFLNLNVREFGKDGLEGISEQAMELLSQYDWPGNVREMQNVIKQAVINCTGSVIIPDFLPDEIKGNLLESGCSTESEEVGSGAVNNDRIVGDRELDMMLFIDERLETGTTDLYAEALEQLECYMFKRVLIETEGNQSQCAKILGITRGKVRDRIQSFGIQLDTKIVAKSEQCD